MLVSSRVKSLYVSKSRIDALKTLEYYNAAPYRVIETFQKELQKREFSRSERVKTICTFTFDCMQKDRGKVFLFANLLRRAALVFRFISQTNKELAIPQVIRKFENHNRLNHQ